MPPRAHVVNIEMQVEELDDDHVAISAKLDGGREFPVLIVDLDASDD